LVEAFVEVFGNWWRRWWRDLDLVKRDLMEENVVDALVEPLVEGFGGGIWWREMQRPETLLGVHRA